MVICDGIVIITGYEEEGQCSVMQQSIGNMTTVQQKDSP